MPTPVSRLFALVSAACLAIVLASCSKPPDPAEILAAMESNTVVAVANGVSVVAGPAPDVLRSCLARYLAIEKKPMPVAVFNNERETVIERLVVEELVRQRVAQSTVRVDEVMLDAEIAQHVTNNYKGDMTLFCKKLTDAGMTLEALRGGMRDELRRMMTMDLDMKPEKVSLEHAAAYYRTHSNEFIVPASVNVRHILLKCGAEASDQKQTQLVQRLEGIRREILRGTKFDDAAKKYSQCPSAAGGGMLGPMTESDTRLSELFLRAAFKASVSNVSRVVATEHGFHLIYVTDKTRVATATFAQVRTSLTRWLTEKERAEEAEAWRRKLREKATVKYK